VLRSIYALNLVYSFTDAERQRARLPRLCVQQGVTVIVSRVIDGVDIEGGICANGVCVSVVGVCCAPKAGAEWLDRFSSDGT